jgi:LacI family transcriptional regulator
MAKQPKVLLLIETSRAYGRGLLHGIMRYSGLHGPWTFYLEPGGMERSLPELANWGADGIIARIPTLNAVKKIIPPGIPAIAIALKEVIPDYPNILSDCELVGKMAAEYFLGKGFKNLAFCGFSDMHWSLERCASFSERVSQAGFLAPQYIRPRFRFERFWNVEQEALANWLKILPKPVGIFAVNDDHSQHLAEAAKIAGIHIPDEIAVLGVDNDELICGLSSPPLSSIAVDAPAAGFAAAELLHKMMLGKKVPHKNILVQPTHVITRQSTDILAVEDREVAEAIRFIRESKHVIQVDDVVAILPMSRRTLELRFRKSINHSINDEIHRVRIQQISKLLLDDSMSISEIAHGLGYADFAHLARYFRKHKGMAPHEFRKKHRYPR